MTAGDPFYPGAACASEAEGIERLAEELHEAERLQRRLDGIRERLQAYGGECRMLELELASARGELQHVQFWPVGLWLGLLGKRAERLSETRARVERAERRLQAKRALVTALESERADAANRAAMHRSTGELRNLFTAWVWKQRAAMERDAPELGARLCALEEQLPQARADAAAAERALANVREIARLLESAHAGLERALKHAARERRLFYFTRRKYVALDAATAELRAAHRLMDELRALDPVRDDLEPLVPDISRALRTADYVIDGLVDMSVVLRMEDSLDGVVEAQKLFGDLAPMLARAAQRARTHAENLERRWRDALVEAATGEVPQENAGP